MDPMIGSSLISAGSNLLGGLMGSKGPDRKASRDMLNIQYAEHVKNIPREMNMRLKSAKAFGVHPLVALGMQPTSMAQAHMVGDTGNDIGSALSEVGQDVSRAVSAYQTKEQRDEVRTLSKLSVERAGLENELLRSQIASQRAQLAPAAPINIDPRYPEQALMPMGYGDTAPLLRKGKDPYGDPVRVYNDDLGDNEVLQALSAIGLSVPDLIANSGKRVGRKIRREYDKTWWNPRNWKK